jgi:hypothetical protein
MLDGAESVPRFWEVVDALYDSTCRRYWRFRASIRRAGASQPYTVVVLHPGAYNITHGQGIAGGQQVGYSQGSLTHPLLWTGTAASVRDLLPAGDAGAKLYGTDGTHQVGSSISATPSSQWHATVWSGSAYGTVDLHPSGYIESYAYAVGGGQAVGIASPITGPGPHAIAWDLATGAATDLNPNEFGGTWAYATDGIHQTGVGTLLNLYPPGDPNRDRNYALLWSGTADSVVVLAADAAAGAICGDQILGHMGGRIGMWVGPDHAWVDLTPPNTEAGLADTNGSYQVGFIYGTPHAARWSGTADSLLDLQPFLPSEFQSVLYPQSWATGIDAAGNIVGEALGPSGWGP